MFNDLKSSQNKIILSIYSCRETIKSPDKMLASFDSTFDLLSNQIISVIKENKLLKSRIEQLESKLLFVEQFQSNTHSINQENFFSEFMDRQSRTRNIILFNLPDLSTINDVHNNDGSLIDKMFNIIGISTKPLSVHRLGRPSTKPRPIRIVMPSPSYVFKF